MRGNPRHPKQIPEAVFEVVDDTTSNSCSLVSRGAVALSRQINSNVMVLGCALQMLRVINRNGMPLCAVRVTDTRIITALLVVLFSEFAFDPLASKPKPTGRKVSSLEQKKGIGPGNTNLSLEILLNDSAEADNVLRSLSLTADAVSLVSCAKMWDKNNLGGVIRGSNDVGKRIQPFLAILASQCSWKDGCWQSRSPVETLDGIEKVC